MAKTSQHAVSVWGSPQTVTVNRISKSVWIVVGDYQGDRIEIMGSSQLSALSRWQEAARAKGDFQQKGVAYNEFPDFLSAVVILRNAPGSVSCPPPGNNKSAATFALRQLSMFNDTKLRAAALIRPGMEVITSDGKRAGYVVSVSTGEIVTRSPERRIALEWVRRVEDDVYLGLRAQQLMWE